MAGVKHSLRILREWGYDRLEQFKSDFPDMSNDELAEKYGISALRVVVLRKMLGLYKSNEYKINNRYKTR
jgi:hypothetical protein